MGLLQVFSGGCTRGSYLVIHASPRTCLYHCPCMSLYVPISPYIPFAGTKQGSLMRTILFATERVTGSTSETYYFIAVLLIFALAASGYVLYEGLYGAQATGGGGNDDDDEHVTRTTGHFKLFLHCTMIITSVVRSNPLKKKRKYECIYKIFLRKNALKYFD